MQAQDLGLLNPWLRNIRDAYRLHKIELETIKDEDAKYNRLVELNVQEQCVNILKAAEVQMAYRADRISIHGWIFDIRNGQLIELKINFDNVLEGLRQFYRLS